MLRRRVNRCFSAAWLVILTISLACNLTGGPDITATSPEATQVAAPTNEPAASPAATSTIETTGDLDCQAKGYPCSYADAEPEALERADDLLSEAAAMVGETGETASVAEYLLGQDEVVEVFVDERVIVFRVREAPPFVVFHPDFGPDYDAPSVESMGSGRLSRPVHPGPLFDDDGPVGWQDPGAEPKKRALLLSPFLWEFKDDESDEIAALLAQIRDYDCEGCVNYIENPDNPLERMAGNLQVGPGVENFTGWDEYDLIHVSTHGLQVCQSNLGPGCMSLIQTGRYVSSLTILKENAVRLHPGMVYGTSPKLPSGWRFELVSSDFFRSQYPGGLPDTLIFFSACQSMKATDLARSLISDNTSVLGWSENVVVSPGKEISLKFYEEFAANGLRSEAAYDKTKGFTGYAYGFEVAKADLLMMGSPDPRGREVITLLHPFYRTELEENFAATTQGTAGDGEDDDLFLAVQIEGVDESQDPLDFEIHISINGQEVDRTFIADRNIGQYVYQSGLITVPLPVDVDNQKTIALEAWADLPGGGRTRHYLESVLPAGCGWNGLVNSSQQLVGNEVIVVNHPVFSSAGDSDQLDSLGYGEDSEFPATDSPGFVLASDSPSGYPIAFAGGGFGSVGLGQADIYGSQSVALNFMEFDSAIYGTVSGSYMGMSGTIQFSGEFYWHVDSRCNFDIKQAAAENR